MKSYSLGKISDGIAGILALLLGMSSGCSGRSGSSVVSSPAPMISSPAPESGAPTRRGREKHRANYVADCNDPESYDPACIHPNAESLATARANGYPYYVGHAEPTVEFFSTAPNSGSNMQWKIKLPATDPTPTQNGSAVANFELFIADWIGLALCDPTSKPYQPCTAASDANNPATAGSAFLELQFYPPGIPGFACSNTQWCAKLQIWSWHDNSTFVTNTCQEPGSSAYLTTSGGTTALFSNGDALIVTIHDTASGLETDINDLTSGVTGQMVASSGNGFVHNTSLINNGVCSGSPGTQCTTKANCPSGQSCVCQTEPFSYHAMYATAAPGHVVTWAQTGPNVSFASEIGHWELCANSSCSSLPDSDSDDSFCSTTRGVGGCTNADTDFDGTSFQADWPDGNASHPSSIIIGAQNNTGVGPMSASVANQNSYVQGYQTVQFQQAGGIGGTFYPFYSQSGIGQACVFNFGNDIPGTTTTDFSKAAQYGTTMSNPCSPGLPAPLIVGDDVEMM